MARKKIIIGSKDVADFPKINQYNVPVKIDSGAYTSSIHYYRAKEVTVDGVKKLKCYFFGPKNKHYKDGIFFFEDFGLKKVTSSNGITQERYTIKTKIKLFNKTYNIELTLAKRSRMKFRVLLGRKFLSQKFVIDTSKRNLSQRNIINHYISQK